MAFSMLGYANISENAYLLKKRNISDYLMQQNSINLSKRDMFIQYTWFFYTYKHRKNKIKFTNQDVHSAHSQQHQLKKLKKKHQRQIAQGER